ncbi:glucuronate isomerase [Lacrimispora brassicae]
MNHQFSEELLLTNQTGSYFYHTYAKHLPIIDYHCHLVAREIYENEEFEDLGEMWLAHDHYKWRAMRTFGIDEYYITGGAGYYEKYLKFAEILPRLMGNPVYIWCALELKRYFDIEKPLGPDNAEEIYKKTKELIKGRHMTPRWCMEQSKVEIVSTTEDPVDTLEYHIRMKGDPAIKTRVLTAFRPDQAFYCEWSSFSNYMGKLSQAAEQEITSFSSMMNALEQRLSFFAEFGTRVSDNGMADITWCDYTMEEVESAFDKAVRQKELSPKEKNQYKSAFVIEMAKLYKKYGFVMQLHIGTYLDANQKKVKEIGQSTGFDCVDDTTSVRSVGAILNRLTELDELPKTILYPLHASQVESFAILAAGFCDGTVKGKVQLGAPWWFNDQSYGIERQFYAAGNLYPVSLSVGMLTDSRSFLSYPRHELYRRVLCSYLGELVERGEYFSDELYIKEMIESICYKNVREYFGW